jgi:methionyl-tRNA formyltransferase
MLSRQGKDIIFMGTPQFAVPSLEAILQTGYRIAAVVTAPDRPAGRGKKRRPSAIKVFAEKHSLPVLQPENLKSTAFVDQLKTIKPWLIVVVAFRMLPKAVWEIPTAGTFNLHASLLPDYRGAAPINHAIVNGDRQTGLTTFFIDGKIDTGEILLQETEPIYLDDDAGQLHDRLMEKGARLVVKTIRAIEGGNAQPVSQTIAPGSPMRPAPKIDRAFCRIDWSLPGEKIHNLIRGLSPYPAAWTCLNDDVETQFKLFKSKLSKPNITNNNIQPGIIKCDSPDHIEVKCGDGWIVIEELQMAGKKRMHVSEFLKGFHFPERAAFL